MNSELLRNRRMELGMTQESLAYASGLAVKTVSAIERGVVKSPDLATVMALANALEMNPIDLIQIDLPLGSTS